MRHGEEDAWTRFFRDYTEPVMAYLCYLGLALDEAEEVWQEVLLKMSAEALQAYRKECGRFRAWLVTVLRNHVRKELSKRNAQKRGGKVTVSGDEPVSPGEPDGPSRFDQLETESARHAEQCRREVEERLRELLANYPDASERDVFLEWFWRKADAEQNDRDFAADQGLTHDQVRYIKSKVEKYLRRHWRPEDALF